MVVDRSALVLAQVQAQDFWRFDCVEVDLSQGVCFGGVVSSCADESDCQQGEGGAERDGTIEIDSGEGQMDYDLLPV
jgi:hypothetical protein